MAGAEGARGDHRVGKGQERGNQGHRQQDVEIGQRQQREREVGKTGRDAADQRHALPVQSQQDNRQHQPVAGALLLCRQHRTGHARRKAAAEQDHGKAGGADRKAREVCLPELPDRRGELVERRGAVHAKTKDFRKLRAQDHQREAMQESGDHRLGQKIRDEAQTEQPCQQADRPDHDAEAGREEGQSRRIPNGERRHRDRDDGRHGGVGSHDEMA